MASGSPGAVFADAWYRDRDVAAAIVAAGLSTGDPERDELKGLELLRQAWCQAYLIARYKEEYGLADLDGRSMPAEVQEELIASQLEAQQALTLIIRDVTTLPRDRINAIKQLEAIRAATVKKVTSREDVARRVKDLLGLP